tara:strand:- start:449 stop:1012 length:564 start_codon:yes stop_codon:yes gene_type:complete
MEVYPIFPTLVSTSTIDVGVDFFRLKTEDTQNIWVLNEYPDIHNQIIKEFYRFKNDVLKLSTVNFKITTSWMTRTNKNESSHFHNHKNSYYSGVLYFEDYDSGNLIFKTILNNLSGMYVGAPDESTSERHETFYIQPRKNLVVFFPSYLEHKIDTYTGDSLRYSLAFNIHPVGIYGDGDSRMHVPIN